MILVACITPLIVPCIFSIFKWKAVYEIDIISTVFTYFASVWGSTLNGYNLPGFENLTFYEWMAHHHSCCYLLYEYQKEQWFSKTE